MPRKEALIVALLALSTAAAGPSPGQEIATTHDTAWISVLETVDSVRSTSFLLDHGDDDITVELDQFE